MSKRSSTRPKQGQSANKPSTNGTTQSSQVLSNDNGTTNGATKTSESELTSKAVASEVTTSSTPTSKQAQPKDVPVSQPSPKSTGTPEKRTAALKTDKPPVKQAFSANRPLTKAAMKSERRIAEQQRRIAEQQRSARNKRIGIISVIAAIVIVGGLITWFVRNPPSSSINPEQVVAQSTPVNSNYPPVDNVACDAGEQLAYHIHVHLSMWIGGSPYTLPQGIGIAPDGSCLYWMHVHDTTGVIHIEAPQQIYYTLGNFFDIWDQSFHSSNYPTQLSATAGWTVYVNGKLYNGDFHNIQLTAHTLVSMMYNSPGAKPDTTYNWNGL